MLCFFDFLFVSLFSFVVFFLVWHLFVVPLGYRHYYSSVGIKCDRFIPLFGDMLAMKDYALNDRTVYFYDDFFKRHQTKIVQHLMGPSFYLLVGDPVALSSILSAKNADSFRKAPIMHRILGLLMGKKSILLLEGKEHKIHRKILSPMFHFANLRSMINSMFWIAQKMTDKLENGELLNNNHENRADKLSNGEEIEIDIDEYFPRVTLEIVIYLVFGASFYSDSAASGLPPNAMDILYNGFTQNALLTRERVLSLINVFPFLSVLPLPSKRKMEDWNNKIDVIVDLIIQSRMEGKTKSQCNGPDLLDLLIKTTKTDFDKKMNGKNNNNEEEEGAAANNNNNDSTNLLTIDAIKDEAKAFILAGSETTASALTWTTYLICEHPDIQSRLQQEVDEVLSNNDGVLSDKCLSDLVLVEAVIQESLRIYPVVPLLPRTVIKDCVIDTIDGQSLLLKEGMDLLLSFEHVHRDKTIWGEDAEIFNPDRFLKEKDKNNYQNEIKKMDASVDGKIIIDDPSSSKENKQKKRPVGSFLPFSLGQRSCIGQHFAMNEAKIEIASLVSRFEMRLAPGQKVIPEIVTALRPLHGLKILLKKRGFINNKNNEEKHSL